MLRIAPSSLSKGRSRADMTRAAVAIETYTGLSADGPAAKRPFANCRFWPTPGIHQRQLTGSLIV
jgi:hypothetical protein